MPIFSDNSVMSHLNSSTTDTCMLELVRCDIPLHSSSKYQRAQQFNKLLRQLVISSKALDYEAQITAFVEMMCTAPVRLISFCRNIKH